MAHAQDGDRSAYQRLLREITPYLRSLAARRHRDPSDVEDAVQDAFVKVHKHIGDYTLFMLGMFPMALARRKGREFILGRLVIPGSSLYEHYLLQGQRSYGLAAEFTDRELFLDLSTHFLLYRNALELVRIFLETAKSREFLRARRIITPDYS